MASKTVTVENLTFYCFTHREHVVQAPKGSKLECPKCHDALYYVVNGTEVPKKQFATKKKNTIIFARKNKT
jgi:Zn finger protein HypA/HybF involved in hydrogenase expression